METSRTTHLSLHRAGSLLCAFAFIITLTLGIPGAAENKQVSSNLRNPNLRIAGLALGGTVRTIAVAPNGDVYAGGHFQNGAGNPYNDFIARWNGTTWQPLGKGLASSDNSGFEGVYAIVFDGTKMYVGGKFDTTGDGAILNNFARWDMSTQTWEPLLYPCSLGMCGPGMTTGYVYALAKPLNGTGVFVGGSFEAPFQTSSATKRVALYDGSTWSALEAFISGTVTTLYVDPLNSDLYAGGQNLFLYSGSQYISTNLVRWDGSAWREIQNAPRIGTIFDVEGNNEGLYVAGSFNIPVGVSGTGDTIYASNIAKWDGADWSRLGESTPIDGDGPIVLALAISGSNIYVGGTFTDPRAGEFSHRFALWDGSSWQDTGASLAPNGGDVYTVAVSGSQVYIGGNFSNAGGVNDADYIARYDGNSWSSLVNPTPTPTITPTPTVTPTITPTPTVTPTPTRLPPTPVVRALGAWGRKGTRIGLRYRVWYFGRSTSEAMWVLKNGRIVRRLRGRFAPRRPTVIYSLPLNTVGLRRGAYRYCVESTDNYARKSKKFCAALTIR